MSLHEVQTQLNRWQGSLMLALVGVVTFIAVGLYGRVDAAYAANATQDTEIARLQERDVAREQRLNRLEVTATQLMGATQGLAVAVAALTEQVAYVTLDYRPSRGAGEALPPPERLDEVDVYDRIRAARRTLNVVDQRLGELLVEQQEEP